MKNNVNKWSIREKFNQVVPKGLYPTKRKEERKEKKKRKNKNIGYQCTDNVTV